MTSFLHAEPGEDRYTAGLRAARFDQMRRSDAVARGIAEQYVGLARR